MNFSDYRRISRSAVGLLAATLLITFAAMLPAQAQKEFEFYSFCRLQNCADGSEANGTLIIDKSGNLYGTTEEGGANGTGTVYRVSPSGTETVLYGFGPASSDGDGSYPQMGLAMDSHGTLYGVTENGGINNYGTLFKVSSDGAETILHTFYTVASDGAYPFGPVVLDKKGNIYGTTTSGGKYGYGVVYKISVDGTETILHSFDPKTGDGVEPFSGPTMDAQGNLYGTTTIGGSHNSGAVFELSAKGVYSVLYSFGSHANDGNTVDSPVTVDAEGNLYGVTVLGGSSNNGIVFKLTPGATWKETILYNFEGYSENDGSQPAGALVIDSGGNLYGTTYQGGGFYNNGTAFELSPSGDETIIYVFTGFAYGGHPSGGVLRMPSGVLYGVTYLGGGTQNGIVYKIVP